jgi:hypothetical protein
MRPKLLRLWAYHAEWRPTSTQWATLPDVPDAHTLRRLRKQARKQARRQARKAKRRRP